jgi:small subunit ribosomal protein S6
VAEVHKEVKMNMNQYEVMYVIDAALEDSARTELINRFSDLVTKNGGEVDRVDEWGKRRLAYAIQYKTEGYYVLMYIKAPAELPREIERNMQISDSVLRYLTVRYEGELPAKREPLKPYAPREAAPAAEAPVEAAVPAEAPVAEAADDEKPESEAE